MIAIVNSFTCHPNMRISAGFNFKHRIAFVANYLYRFFLGCHVRSLFCLLNAVTKTMPALFSVAAVQKTGFNLQRVNDFARLFL